MVVRPAPKLYENVVAGGKFSFGFKIGSPAGSSCKDRMPEAIFVGEIVIREVQVRGDCGSGRRIRLEGKSNLREGWGAAKAEFR